MQIAILDAFSGISGDMTLGALLEVGLDPDWLRALPGVLGLGGVEVRIAQVQRSGIACSKVDFAIPPQPHGRHIREIRSMLDAAPLPEHVRARAHAAFLAIASVEGAIHGVPVERVHLHEVGAVDAILDIVGAVWGFDRLGVERIHCGAIALGDGTVSAAHGELPVPAPATLRLLEGHEVRPGPAGSGELVTPTGAALVRVLSSGPPPARYVPARSGFGAGARELPGRPNALRIVLGTVRGVTDTAGAGDATAHSVAAEQVVMLSADIDDMTGEQLGAVAEAARDAGALDVVLVPTVMKKGRPGTRVDILARPADVDRLEGILFAESTTLGVRRAGIERRVLARRSEVVAAIGGTVRVKVATLPDGRERRKPEADDVAHLAAATGQSRRAVEAEVRDAAERRARASEGEGDAAAPRPALAIREETAR